MTCVWPASGLLSVWSGRFHGTTWLVALAFFIDQTVAFLSVRQLTARLVALKNQYDFFLLLIMVICCSACYVPAQCVGGSFSGKLALLIRVQRCGPILRQSPSEEIVSNALLSPFSIYKSGTVVQMAEGVTLRCCAVHAFHPSRN